MRIRYLIMSYFRMSGVARTVISQARAMADAGHDVEVVGAVQDFDEPFFVLPEGIRFTSLIDARDHDPDDGPGILVPVGEAKYAVFTQRVETAVVNYLASLKGGILVTTRPALNLLAARFGNPSTVRVAQEHMHLAHHQPDVREAIVRHYPKLDTVVTLTDGDRADYAEALGEHAPGLITIPNFLHQESLDSNLRSSLERPVVVAAGRLTRQKGFDLLVKAFGRVVKTHPEWELHIYGEGSQERAIRRKIDRCGLHDNVRLMGATNDLNSRFAESSLFVLSSRFEGFSLVLVEAMSVGLPVVAFDCPRGPSEIIRSPAEGLLVPANDVPALAKAISRVISKQKLRRRLGSAAFRRAGDFIPSQVAPKWESLFRRLAYRKLLRRLVSLPTGSGSGTRRWHGVLTGRW